MNLHIEHLIITKLVRTAWNKIKGAYSGYEFVVGTDMYNNIGIIFKANTPIIGTSHKDGTYIDIHPWGYEPSNLLLIHDPTIIDNICSSFKTTLGFNKYVQMGNDRIYKQPKLMKVVEREITSRDRWRTP